MSLTVVKIEKITPHPNASKLKLCTVTDGSSEYELVCGASNARLGLLTVMAPEGSTTPTGLLIRPTELRGVISKGMLCSPTDLAVSKESGLVDLPNQYATGTPLDDIENEHLSSTPWYKYELVEAFTEAAGVPLSLKRGESLKQISKNEKIVSKTYFFEGKYLYRHF